MLKTGHMSSSNSLVLISIYVHYTTNINRSWLLPLWSAGKYVLETGHMSGSNSFVFSAKRRGSNTPVVCKFFADQDSFKREMKFFERVHTGDFVPG